MSDDLRAMKEPREGLPTARLTLLSSDVGLSLNMS